jgi:hypothetical protein
MSIKKVLLFTISSPLLFLIIVAQLFFICINPLLFMVCLMMWLIDLLKDDLTIGF